MNYQKKDRDLTLKEFARLYSSPDDDIVVQKHQESFMIWLKQLQLPKTLVRDLQLIYVPFINLLITKKYLKKGKIPLIGISGSQGSGKSTFTFLLKKLLETEYGYRVVSFSIDDFYHTRAIRETLSRTIHPLLVTRGVPGTHNVEAGIRVTENLLGANNKTVTAIPVFDKSIDDQKPLGEWNIFSGRPDLILFEGWCVGAVPEKKEQLSSPVNELERVRDPDATFRKFVNNQLSSTYKKWFSMIDLMVMLKVSSFKQVYEWRLLQEQKLADSAASRASAGKVLKIMSEKDLRFFISHYERITRHMLKEMPDRANMVLEIGKDHCFKKVLVNKI